MKQNRIHKGKNLIAFPDSFTIIDIETTGLSPEHDDLIELSAMRVSNGSITETFSSLVKPKPRFDGNFVNDFIARLTGITNDMLSDAPDLSVVLPEYLDFLGDDVLVGHNCSAFDINFLYDNSENVCSRPLKNDFIDTLRISRKLHPELSHHRLSDLCGRYSIDYSEAHRALSDCEITAKCYKALRDEILSQFGDLKNFTKKTGNRTPSVKPSGILPTNSNINVANPFYGKTFVFTGALEKMTRNEAMQIIANYGCISGSSVTRKTNYLVLGNSDYASGKSGKQKKAEELKLDGYDIEIIPENVFYDMFPIPDNGNDPVSQAIDLIRRSEYPEIEKHTMTMLVKDYIQIEKNKAVLSEPDLNDGFLKELHSASTDDNKYLRKLLNLPITKELWLMKKERGSFVPHKVKRYQIADWYAESNTPSLTVTLEDGQTARILGDYFSHMQKTSFEKDIAYQEKNLE